MVVENMTSNNRAMTLNVFVDYVGCDELVAAVLALATEAVARTIRSEDVSRHCYAPDLPETTRDR